MSAIEETIRVTSKLADRKNDVMYLKDVTMKYLSLIIFCLLLFCVADAVEAKEWRGIVPARSTRADVVRLFGQCSNVETGCQFQVENEQVLIVFLRGSMIEAHQCTKTLPPDTVLLVEVQLIAPVKLQKLRINKKSFRTFDPSTPRNIGYKGYIDENQGLVIKTYKGDVLQLDYIAARRDVYRCRSYYDEPKSFIQLMIEMCCPPLFLNCPSTPVTEGDRIALSADTDERERVTFRWTLTAGTIVEGQGTSRITVDTTGVAVREITATVERDDGNQHLQTASCTWRVSAKPD